MHCSRSNSADSAEAAGVHIHNSEPGRKGEDEGMDLAGRAPERRHRAGKYHCYSLPVITTHPSTPRADILHLDSAGMTCATSNTW